MDVPSQEEPSTSTSTSTTTLSPPPLNQPDPSPPSPPPPSTPSEKSSSLTPSKPSTSLTPSSIPHHLTHLTHLTRILSTTSGLSTTLLTLTYTLHLLHSLLLPLSHPRQAPTAPSSAQNHSSSRSPLSTLPSGEKPLATIARAPSPRLTRTLLSLRASTALLDDTRLFLRLFGLLEIYTWFMNLHASPPSDAWLRRIAYAQVAINAFYQVLENGAYLASHRVFRWPEAKVNRWYVWSSRFWMGHVGLEGCRLGREWVLGRRVEEGRGGRAEEVGVKMERVRREGRWWREVVVNAAWAPLTVHWSVEGGVVGEGVVAGLGMVAGWVEMRELWRRTT